MKKLQRRTLFVLLFILALAAGTVVLCAFYVKDGAQWASFYGNQHVYTNGRIASGSIQDRNGTTLFDCAEGQYSDDKTTRISTLHAIGDKQGNINTGAKNLFADQLVGFSLITGTSGTGNTIKLTLDANLNNAAYQAMAGRKGVAALYNYETGEVLCMLSTPSFDPADDAEVAKVAAGDSNYDGAYHPRLYLQAGHCCRRFGDAAQRGQLLLYLHWLSDLKRREDHLPQRPRHSGLRHRSG